MHATSTVDVLGYVLLHGQMIHVAKRLELALMHSPFWNRETEVLRLKNLLRNFQNVLYLMRGSHRTTVSKDGALGWVISCQ